MIAKLQISVERKFVYPFFKVIDQNNSGGIEYEEFEAYILGKNWEKQQDWQQKVKKLGSFFSRRLNYLFRIANYKVKE